MKSQIDNVENICVDQLNPPPISDAQYYEQVRGYGSELDSVYRTVNSRSEVFVSS